MSHTHIEKKIKRDLARPIKICSGIKRTTDDHILCRVCSVTWIEFILLWSIYICMYVSVLCSNALELTRSPLPTKVTSQIWIRCNSLSCTTHGIVSSVFLQWNHKKCFIHIGMDVTITYCIAMETVMANSEGKQHRKSHSKEQCNWFSPYPVLNVSRVYEKCNQSQISTNLIMFMIEIWSDFRFFFLLDISFQMCFFLNQTLFFFFCSVETIPLIKVAEN